MVLPMGPAAGPVVCCAGHHRMRAALLQQRVTDRRGHRSLPGGAQSPVGGGVGKDWSLQVSGVASG